MAFPPKGKVAAKVPAVAKGAAPSKPPMKKGAPPMAMMPGAGFKKGGAVKKGC